MGGEQMLLRGNDVESQEDKMIGVVMVCRLVDGKYCVTRHLVARHIVTRQFVEQTYRCWTIC